jgi:hypothetical protein
LSTCVFCLLCVVAVVVVAVVVIALLCRRGLLDSTPDVSKSSIIGLLVSGTGVGLDVGLANNEDDGGGGGGGGSRGERCRVVDVDEDGGTDDAIDEDDVMTGYCLSSVCEACIKVAKEEDSGIWVDRGAGAGVGDMCAARRKSLGPSRTKLTTRGKPIVSTRCGMRTGCLGASTLVDDGILAGVTAAAGVLVVGLA